MDTKDIQKTDSEKRLKVLDDKVKSFEKQKIEAESELKMLKKQHSELIEQLKSNGINNVEDLPKIIENLENEFNQKLEEAEADAAKIEQKISAFHETSER